MSPSWESIAITLDVVVLVDINAFIKVRNN